MTAGWVTAAAAPLVSVLLLGGAMAGASPSTPTQPGAEPSVFPSDLPGPAVPFTGTGRGCTVIDPTGTGGCLTPAAAWMLVQVSVAFGPLPGSCWDAHAWNPTSDHPRGRACDFTVGRIGAFPNAAEASRGWVLARWLQLNADALGVSYLVWDGQIWSAGRADEGWRPYTGGGIYDSTEATGGHYDHVHVSVTNGDRP